MAHIHTGENQHDHTVSGFIFLKDEYGVPHLLLHMHRKVGKLLQIGGHIELDENPWDAIKHELAEETGYDVEQLSIYQPVERLINLPNAIVHPVPVVVNTHNYESGDTSHRHIDTVYAFLATSLPKNLPESGESNDIRWFTKHQLRRLSLDETTANAKAIGEYIFEHVIPNWKLETPYAFTQEGQGYLNKWEQGV